MKVSMRYLIKKALTWCWLAALIGCLFAGGYYMMEKRNLSSEPVAFETADAAEDSREILYAMYEVDYVSYDAAEGNPALGLSDYADSVNVFIIGKLQSDSSYWSYYDTVLTKFPTLEQRIFTSDRMRDMINVWQYGYDIVISVKSPEISDSEESHYAAAFGLVSDEDQFHHLTKQEKAVIREKVLCQLRDLVYQAVNDHVVNANFLDESLAVMHRADARYEQMMGGQSLLIAKERGNQLSAPRSISKKKVLLVFMLGGAMAEGIVLLWTILNGQIKDERELLANTNLTLLQKAAPADDWLEAALRLRMIDPETKAFSLLGIGLQEDELQKASQAMNAALEKVYAQDAQPVIAVNASRSDLSWTLALEDRPIVLLVQQLKTTFDDLRSASEYTQLLPNQVCGVVMLTASCPAKRKG